MKYHSRKPNIITHEKLQKKNVCVNLVAMCGNGKKRARDGSTLSPPMPCCVLYTMLLHLHALASYNSKSSTSFQQKCKLQRYATYLIFVIFLHKPNFWRIKFTPKKRVNYDKIHSILPIFFVITAKYTVNCQIFALNL